MLRNNNLRLAVSILCALFGAIVLPKSVSAAPPEKLAQAVNQVDGITSAAVDKMWSNTDHFWHDGDYYRIVDLIRVIVEADPSFGEAYSSGAWLLWSLGDTDNAAEFLRYGVANAPKSAKWELEYEFGYALFDYKKDYQAALPHLKAATTTYNAPVPAAWTTLAHCYDKLGRYEESVAAWERTGKRFPGFPSVAPNLARVRAKLKAASGN